jgi:hypothetical protein
MWLRRGNFEVFTNFLDEVVVDFAMPRHRGGFTSQTVDVNGVFATLTKEFTAVRFEVSNESSTFH